MAVTLSAVRTAAASPAADPLCLHCGVRCDDGGVSTAEGAFCCAGCAAVYDLLRAHGLTDYYTCDPRAGVSQRARGPVHDDRFAALDDPAVAARLVRTVDGATTVTFAVPALHCASCVWLLEQLWRFDGGIARSEVDLVRRTLRIAFDPGATSPRAIAGTLASLGYEPAIDAERQADPAPAARRALYLKLGVAGFAFGNMMLFSIPRYANGAPLSPEFQRLFDALNLAFAVPVLLFSASDYFRSAAAALRARTVTLDVPVALGLATMFARSTADIALGRGEGFLDSFAGLVFFLLIGRLLQQKAFEAMAFDRTVRSFLPLSARVERAAGDVLVPLAELSAGDIVRLRCGEVVPADGVLIDDAGAIDYAFVTGESEPVPLARGSRVQAGGRASHGGLRVALTGPASNSRLAALWTDPVFTRPKPQALTDLSVRFGQAFTAAAVLLALAGAAAWWPDAVRAADVATAVLIIACPCALTISAPIALGTGMGILGRAGCYLRQPGVLLDLARVTLIDFDKTGTLTGGTSAVSLGGLPEDAWRKVRQLAAASVHPVSRALAASGRSEGAISGLIEHDGAGLRAEVDGVHVAIGSAAFVGVDPGVAVAGRTYASVAGAGVGTIDVAATLRPGVIEAVRELASGHETWLLSGDHARGAAQWAVTFNGRARFEQSPADKLATIRRQQAASHRVLMIGDGLNDAGALAAADVAIAVSDETACLVPACDALLRGDRVAALPAILRYARQAHAVIVLCFAVSVVYNVGGLWLALAGRLTPLATAVLMPVSSLTIVALSAGLMRLHGRRVAA